MLARLVFGQVDVIGVGPVDGAGQDRPVDELKLQGNPMRSKGSQR